MGSAGDQRGGAVRAARSLSACSPLAVGAFGWLIAHLLTLLLLAHSHGGTLSLAVQGLHDYTTTATVLVGCLAVVLLLMMPVNATAPHPSRPEWLARGPVVRRFVAMSALAFVAAQLIEHTVFDGVRMPPTVLLAGILLHALFGALSALTWHQYHDAVHRLWPLARPTAAAGPAPLPSTSMSLHEPGRPVFSSCVTGRAPPTSATTA